MPCPSITAPRRSSTPWAHAACLALAALWCAVALGADAPAPAPASAEVPASARPARAKASTPAPTPAVSSAKEIGAQVRAALQDLNPSQKSLPLVVDGKQKKVTAGELAPRVPPPRPAVSATAQQYQRARAIAHRKPVPTEAAKKAREETHEVHWSYEGEAGPSHWSQLKPDYQLCAAGRRQSPIHIESEVTLLGPAEPIRFDYHPSQGLVVHNGHTIQVDVSGDNHLNVRDTSYQLVQFHFHHPSEERIDGKGFAMVAHLVHRGPDGQLAVLAVLLEEGDANPLLHKVWTYMPLDEGDKVRMPPELLDLNELLPRDQRYYQFMGSLTTPPCSEGVLWLILKQPMTLSADQLRLFGKLFPNNARPVQPLNGRPVREAQ